MKVLNLYAGIGGNRKLWKDVEVTAVELDPIIAQVYQDLYPADTIIVGNAHKYLVEHYTEFDFIWSSPPCQSHSSMRQNLAVRFRGTPAVYPDMKLYQEIIFLQYNAQCQWIVENVKPYYNPLIKPSAVLQRHCFWSNFPIDSLNFKKDMLRIAQIEDLQEHTGIIIDHYQLPNKRQILRNCVYPELGQWIFQQAQRWTDNNANAGEFGDAPQFQHCSSGHVLSLF